LDKFQLLNYGRVLMRQTFIHNDILPNLASFVRYLRSENASPKTRETFTESVGQLVKYLESQGMPLDLRREHIESFIAHLLEHWKPATANNRYRGLQSFFKWLVSEGEIKDKPMGRMKPPVTPNP